MRVVGIDGCKGGWICVALEGGRAEHWVSPHIADALQREPAADLVLVDIPIGLLEGGPERRAPDVAARRALRGKRASSVFSAPIRPALYAPDYPAANRLSRDMTGRGLSKQTWAIVPKIREVDETLRLRPEWRQRVREVHPELCFWAFAGSQAMEHNKKTDEGFKERLDLLVERFPGAEDLLGRIVLWEGKRVARDDAVDALAAALTGVDPGAMRSLPETPARDALGLRMEMVYAARKTFSKVTVGD